MRVLGNFLSLFQIKCFKDSVVLLYVFCFFVCTSVFSAVIEIDSLDELQQIGNDAAYPLDGEYVLTQDIDASATLNWNDGAGFIPIGTSESPFAGKFDGNGHKIMGLYVNYNLNYNGLFSYISSVGEVKNLMLDDCWVEGYMYVGGLVAINEGSITNCHSTGFVLGYKYVGSLVGINYGSVTNSYSMGSVSDFLSGEYLGGLVGKNDGGIISNSYSMCSVSGFRQVGGLAGINDSDGSITNSYSIGKVSGSIYVGGLVGVNYSGGITTCYFAGKVAGTGPNISDIGGLVGYNDEGTVVNSYWDVETSGQSSSSGGEGKTTAEMKQQLTYTGWDFSSVWDIDEGINYPYLRILGHTVEIPLKQIGTLDELSKIGVDAEYPLWANYELTGDIDATATVNWNEGKGFKPIGIENKPFESSFDGKGYKIMGLYVNRPDESWVGLFGYIGGGGEVKNLGLEGCEVIGSYGVGTLVGYNNGNITTCYGKNGRITAYFDVEISSSGSYAGGLVGYNGGSITNSYSTNLVSGFSKVGGLAGINDHGVITNNYCTNLVSGALEVGGLVGNNYNGTIINSYSISRVLGITITNNSKLGGLVGINDNGSITNSYSIGNVSSENGDYLGGLVGKDNNGSVTNSYWNTETSGQSASTGGEGKTTVEMKQQTTYTDWDFSNVWNIEEEISYPYLRALGPTYELSVKEIGSLEELNKIGVDIEYPLWGEYELVADIDARETVNWNEGKGFKPIGSENKPFIGKFYGEGHKIVGLYINRSDEAGVGFFGYVGELGEVKGLKLGECVITGSSYVGGLVGSNSGTVSNSYCKSLVEGKEQYVGGLVGLNSGTIANTYSTGSVTGSQDKIGGLVGSNSGTVSNSYSTSSVKGGYNDIGGLIGYNNKGAVSNSYSMGLVLGTGGLIGRNFNGTIQGCYWDTQTSGQTISDGGVGKTTTEMIQEATFGDWDFTTIWTIEGELSYPYLQGLGENQIFHPTREIKEINNLEELSRIGLSLDYPWWWDYVLMADINANDTVGWNGGRGFKPLLLTGLFHGNRYVISGMNINRPDENYVGLFGYIGSSGQVKDIGMENCQIIGREFVGKLVGLNNGGSVSGAYSMGSVSGGYYIGGLMGCNIGSIINSYSTGSVDGYWKVGGLIGYNYQGNISNSYSTDSVSGFSAFGGLVGTNEGTVSDCYSFGSVEGDSFAGGLVGENNDTISGSYSTGSVVGQNYNVGGLVGWNYKTVSNCYSTGSVNGNENIGGLVGMNYGTISNSYSTGSVSGENKVGGLIGRDEYSIAEGEKEENAIPENYGIDLVKEIMNYKIDSFPEKDDGSLVYNCYSIGLVVGSENVGGLIGYNNGGTVENSYWDTQTSVQNTSAGGTGKTTEEMEQQATFVGWDFITIWAIIEEQTYPYFLWQTPPTEGEGSTDGEGTPEGEMPPHSADPNGDGIIDLGELLRVIQFFNMGGYHCEAGTEDGYAGGYDGDKTCTPHASDYDEQDWTIDLGELLRLIQFFNMGGYYPCPGIGEDGYCPGTE